LIYGYMIVYMVNCETDLISISLIICQCYGESHRI
jgi:hypothetical protein